MTTPLEFYAAAGSARPGLWRLFVGIVLVVIGWLGWTIVMMAGFVLFKLAGGLGVKEALSALSAFLETPSPASVIFQLATFIGVWPAIWAVREYLHDQPFGTLFSPEGRMRWGDFGRGALLAAAALVWRTGSIAAAMGLHTGMNLFSLSTVGLGEIIGGTQLFLYEASEAELLFVVDGVSTLAVLLFVLSPLCPIRARALA